jgi:hypothetical protein
VSHGVLGSSSVPTEKAVLLVGWLRPSRDDILWNSDDNEDDEWMKEGLLSANWVQVEAEDFVNAALLAAIVRVDESVGDAASSLRGLSRSSSCAQRASYALGQELSCNAVCVLPFIVLYCQLMPLSIDYGISTYSGL